MASESAAVSEAVVAGVLLSFLSTDGGEGVVISDVGAGGQSTTGGDTAGGAATAGGATTAGGGISGTSVAGVANAAPLSSLLGFLTVGCTFPCRVAMHMGHRLP